MKKHRSERSPEEQIKALRRSIAKFGDSTGQKASALQELLEQVNQKK